MAVMRPIFELIVAIVLIVTLANPSGSQGRRAKARISNAGFTITALPLLAAKDWGVFNANGLDVELIVMSPTLAAAAIAQGDIDYVAGVGPASVAATLTGLPSRAIWFSSDRISYWLQSAPQYKTIQEVKGKKIAISGGVGGTNHVALSIALEKIGCQSKRLRYGRRTRATAAGALFSRIRFRRGSSFVSAAYVQRRAKGF